ncbi:hypothetical protein ACEQPO_15555 [Bacillus sp. SL00103]
MAFYQKMRPLLNDAADEGIAFYWSICPGHSVHGQKIEARKTMDHQRESPLYLAFQHLFMTQKKESVKRSLGCDHAPKHQVEAEVSACKMLVRNDEGRKALKEIKKERKVFNDGTLYMEKVIEDARHIEIQVLFDSFRHGVHLFERDCSLKEDTRKSSKKKHQCPVSMNP